MYEIVNIDCGTLSFLLCGPYCLLLKALRPGTCGSGCDRFMQPAVCELADLETAKLVIFSRNGSRAVRRVGPI